ncbi:MAG: STAS/SEC14 domain-containing protein [Sedimentisphaerales bacterium]|nr:STAS/SEC14 domain-containing protein [Sedimentisphaerales bacterium]
MKWTVYYLEKDGIVLAKAAGLMDWEQHKAFAMEIYPFARKHKTNKILIDFREMVPSFTILQIDDLPRLLKEAGVGSDFRIAALHDPSAPHHSENVFFKNAAAIASIQVRYFTDTDMAIAWLKSDEPNKTKQ